MAGVLRNADPRQGWESSALANRYRCAATAWIAQLTSDNIPLSRAKCAPFRLALQSGYFRPRSAQAKKARHWQRAATRLCDASDATIHQVDGAVLRQVALLPIPVPRARSQSGLLFYLRVKTMNHLTFNDIDDLTNGRVGERLRALMRVGVPVF